MSQAHPHSRNRPRPRKRPGALNRRFDSRFCGVLASVVAVGFAPFIAADTPAPKLIDMQVESMPTVDPAAPAIEALEVRASRTEASIKTNYSIALQGTLARPAGLDHAYGPMAWSVTQALDADGQPMRFTTDGYAKPDALLNEPVAELYRRLGPTMVRVSAQRLTFSIQLNNLDYLTPRLSRLAIRSYAILAEDEQALELDLPAMGTSADVAGAWVLTVEQLGDRQELLLHASDPDPAVWPVRLELIDGEGKVISTGFRRGSDTRDHTPATQWRFTQPTLVVPTTAAAEPNAEADAATTADPDTLRDDTPTPAAASPAPQAGWRLRVHHATGLRLQQLDAVLGDVELIDLTAPAEPVVSP